MKISSTFAILDVKAGRQALEKHFRGRPPLGECPEHLRIPIVIKGYLGGIHGGDDGVSREFTVHVDSVEVSIPYPDEFAALTRNGGPEK